MFVQPAGNSRLAGKGAGERGGIAAHPVPGIAAIRAGDGAGRQGVIHPGDTARCRQGRRAIGSRTIADSIGRGARGGVRTASIARGDRPANAAGGRQEDALAGVVISTAAGSFQFHSPHHIIGPGARRVIGERSSGNGRSRQAGEPARTSGAVDVIADDAVRRGSPIQGYGVAVGNSDEIAGGSDGVQAQGRVAHEGDVSLTSATVDLVLV